VGGRERDVLQPGQVVGAVQNGDGTEAVGSDASATDRSLAESSIAGGEQSITAGNQAAGGDPAAGQTGKDKEKLTALKAKFEGKSELKKGEGKKGDWKKGDFKGGKREFGRNDFGGSVKRSDNPDVLYGRDFEDEAMKIEDIIGEMGEVVIRGKILTLETREIKNEKTIIIFDVTDFTDTMTVKMFAKNEQVKEITSGVKAGAFVKVKGISMIDKFDHELTIGSVAGIKKIPDFTTSRMDTAPHKRVELHCHTKMSDMDGVSEAKDIVKRAYLEKSRQCGVRSIGHRLPESGLELMRVEPITNVVDDTGCLKLTSL
jgi:DNA polymerase-3 subunit alpha (Gram-positive type)